MESSNWGNSIIQDFKKDDDTWVFGVFFNLNVTKVVKQCSKSSRLQEISKHRSMKNIQKERMGKKVPSKEQVDALSKELSSRSSIPDHVYKAIDALPLSAHPMTQFTTGVMALQVQSEFQKAYENGISKAKFWEPTYEDSLNLIAQVPVVASYIYRSDHEGGNVSAHTAHLVASALSDPYLSFGAALNGLLLEVLLWIKSVLEECGENITTEHLKDYVWKTLKSGK
ncbi:hypothetical protein HPP92_022429, partial [Vanilla planifolia]